MMRILARAFIAGLILAGILAACSSDNRVPLATSQPDVVGCPLARASGTLVTDAESGTAIVVGTERRPVIWPYGFSARKAASVVEVLDAEGDVVARTGESVGLSGGLITGDTRWTTCGPPVERH